MTSKDNTLEFIIQKFGKEWLLALTMLVHGGQLASCVQTIFCNTVHKEINEGGRGQPPFPQSASEGNSFFSESIIIVCENFSSTVK